MPHPVSLAFSLVLLLGDEPVTEGPAGKRAFDELAAYYADGKAEPGYRQAITDVNSAKPEVAARGGEYLFVLFAQLWADEKNGRSPPQRTPFFDGRSISSPRDLRRAVAQAFEKDARGEAALPAVRWLLEQEQDDKNQAAAVEVLRRLKSPAAAELLRKILAEPHPNEAVLRTALAESAARRLEKVEEAVLRLTTHHRRSIREAARALAAKAGARLPDFHPEDGFGPWLVQRMDEVHQMIATEIPKEATWARFEIKPESGSERDVPKKFGGWLLGETDGRLRILDYFGVEHRLAKARVKASPCTLAEEVQALRAAREEVSKDRFSKNARRLSRRGSASAQFEPGFVSLPEILVSLWCYRRGQLSDAAGLFFPRIEATPDDRWVFWAARDLLATTYHQVMVGAFSLERDLVDTLALARHLAKPVFQASSLQVQAKELAGQLAGRLDDFSKLKLLDDKAWAELKSRLGRAEQIKFLAGRLRLLNCIQMSQPGGVEYEDTQYAQVPRDGEVINPFVELSGMHLDLVDLPTLVPFLADEQYMPTYSYWRDFHPRRTLHRTNWLVASLVNGVAKRDLAELAAYVKLDAAGKKQHLEKILAWAKAHADKKRDELPDPPPPKQPNDGFILDAP
jgi:hypothetical protein